jgi:hypothetical protein
MLSRNRRALMPNPSASAVVTGTYAVDTDSLYVSLKLGPCRGVGRNWCSGISSGARLSLQAARSMH